MKLYIVMFVLSLPPCIDDVDVNAPPALPSSSPRNHSPPSESRNAFSSDETLPKRVGDPKIMASARSSLPVWASVFSFQPSRLSFHPGTLSDDVFRHEVVDAAQRHFRAFARAPSAMPSASAAVLPLRE